jgi:hypothetical protein
MNKYIKVLRDIVNECLEYTNYYEHNRSVNVPLLYRVGRIDASTRIKELVESCIYQGEICLDTIKWSILKYVRLADSDYTKGFNDQLLVVVNKLEREKS